MNNFSWHNYLNQVNQHTFIKMFAFLEHDLVKLGHELDEILRSYVNYYDNNLITSILDKFVISRVIQYLTPTLVLEKEAYEKKYKLSFDEYLKNNFEDLYTKYPVTKVLLESVINETKIFCKELINNLNLDYADLAIFDLDKNYLLKNIQPVGDVHEYGKSVLLLVFVAKVNGVEKKSKINL